MLSFISIILIAASIVGMKKEVLNNEKVKTTTVSQHDVFEQKFNSSEDIHSR